MIALVATEPADRATFIDGLVALLSSGHRLAYGMLQNAHEAEDAVQDAAFKAWRGRADFRAGAELRPWFLAIVANECRQRRRSRWWSVVKLGALPVAPDPPGSAGDAEATDLRAAVLRLPENMRIVIVLRYYMDLPFDEIGRTLNCSPEAAKSRTHRALERLRIEIPEDLQR
jgi:RNA polymerase sigma-70 factor (ECF subfamily)